jgi:hypothetical protein
MSLPPRGAEIPDRIYMFFFKDHGEGPHQYLWPGEVKQLFRDAHLTLRDHKPSIMLPLGSDGLVKKSEQILTFLFGKTPLANFGVRHFYVAQK